MTYLLCAAALAVLAALARHEYRDTDDDRPPSVCPDHGPLSDDGRCYECEHNDLLIDTALEDRAWPELRHQPPTGPLG